MGKSISREAKIRVAVVGLGYWGPNIVRNVMNHPRLRLEGLCDQDVGRLARFQQQGVPIVTTSFAEVCRNSAIDAVILVTPVQTHYPLAKAALEAGKHVWVEKPLTDTAAHAEELVTLARAKRRCLFVDHTFVYNAAVQTTRAMIDAGELGDIYYFDSTRINLGLLQQDVNVIWDLAPHDLAILNFLLGRYPHSVTAIGAAHNAHHLEDVAYVTFLYHDGVIAHLNFNWLSPLKVRRILIGGAKRMLVYDEMDPAEKIKIYDKGITVFGGRMDREGLHQMLINYRSGEMRAPHVDNTEALFTAVDHFAASIVGNTAPLSGGIEGLMVVQMIEAIQTSLRSSGKAVRLPPAYTFSRPHQLRVASGG